MQDKRLKYGYSLIIVFLLFCNITTIAQSWIWSRQAKPIGAGIGEVSTDHSVATDNKGNSYYTGYFQDTISFGSYTLFPKSIRNFFLVKYNSNGNVLWAKQANEASIFSGGVGESVAIDNLGNVYVTGFFGDTVSFGGDTLRSHIFGNEEVFLTKYSSSGTVLWAKQSYSNDAQGNSIAVDKSGYIYITGFYVDTVSFDGDTLLTINPRGYDEVFLTKYSPGGTVLWANQANETKSGFSSAEGNSVATDNSGNIFITGRFIDTTSFGNDTIHTYSNGDIFLVKYAPSGVVLWAKQNNDIKNYANFQNGVSLATDNSNNIYITGFFWDSVAFGNDTLRSQMFYSNQAFLVKYAPNGNVLWAEQSNTPDSNSWYGFSVSIDTLKQCN
ncbi:MAG: hypothetical protein HKL88_10660, partial [Bacteroidia bacterium]|nr:hypothetical protein [Bacteroidia bacterium]